MARSKKEAKERKELILRKLDESISYCNSHHDPVQERFERVVDLAGARARGVLEPERRMAEMKCLFPVLLDREMRGFVPSLKMNDSELKLGPEAFLDRWFSKWVKKYLSAWKDWPSGRAAKPKDAATDEALVQMLVPHAGSEHEARIWARHHNYFMSAENKGGNLLEEYVARKVAPFGWIWCRGEILTAVDFCTCDCTGFIQIKNKSNTENSSGKGFRDDHNAPMWYRMEAQRKAGLIVTRWPELVEHVRRYSDPAASIPDDLMNETDYLAFVSRAAEANHSLVSGEEKGLNADTLKF